MSIVLAFINFISEWPYLIKASLILSLLYLPYHFLFSKDSSFVANRIYLLVIMILTSFIPLIDINVSPVWVSMMTNMPTLTADLPDSSQDLSGIIKSSFLLVYVTGALWFLFHMILNVNRLLVIKNGAVSIQQKNHILVIGTQYPVSSFLNYIFLPSIAVDQMLVQHEMIHVEQRHSIDILLSEFFKCIFWFHPLAYKLRQAISLNHEYECDNRMSEIYTYEQYGNLLLLHAQAKTNNTFINYFYSFIKKRLAMMSQQKSNPKQSHRYLLMIPILLSVFVLFSFRTYYIPKPNPNLTTLKQDTVPLKVTEIIDTIITIDLENYTETVKIVKRQTTEPLDEEEIIRLHPEIITISDTNIILDPNTYEERIVISSTKMKKGYMLLIQEERKKPNPNYELIDKWTSEGSKY